MYGNRTAESQPHACNAGHSAKLGRRTQVMRVAIQHAQRIQLGRRGRLDIRMDELTGGRAKQVPAEGKNRMHRDGIEELWGLRDGRKL